MPITSNVFRLKISVLTLIFLSIEHFGTFFDGFEDDLTEFFLGAVEYVVILRCRNIFGMSVFPTFV